VLASLFGKETYTSEQPALIFRTHFRPNPQNADFICQELFTVRSSCLRTSGCNYYFMNIQFQSLAACEYYCSRTSEQQ